MGKRSYETVLRSVPLTSVRSSLEKIHDYVSCLSCNVSFHVQDQVPRFNLRESNY